MKTFICILITILGFLPFQVTLADTERRSPSEDGVFTAGPYYNAATQSYFELIRTEKNSWQEASELAANYSFKNTAGQLATINQPETHLFIVRNFFFMEDTWIGLRFFCKDAELKWVNGSSQNSSRFSNWRPTAQLGGVVCTDNDYVAAFINRNAFDWSLNVTDMRANQILIEYPTGRQ